MIRTLAAVNCAAVVFSLVWLVGHSTVRIGDWEFWFAAGYLLLAGANAAHFARRLATRGTAGAPGDPAP